MTSVAANPTNVLASERRKAGKITIREWQDVIDRHRLWVESKGEEGEQADLSRANLEGLDLTDAPLQAAILNQAKLRGDDLLLADLRGASLLQADLSDTNLLGTKFREANLQGTTFAGAKALLAEQLAGANLFGAVLPDTVSAAEAVKQVGVLVKRVGRLLGATLLFTVLACLRAATVTDAQLIRNAPTLPFIASGSALPLIPFFLFCPVVILGLYVFLHFHFQRLWETVADLPAILPDGLRLDSCLPWFAKWPARAHFRWLQQECPSLAALGACIAKLLLYAPALGAIFLFWGRYLTLQDLRGTTLHIVLAVASAAAAMHFLAAAHRAFGSGLRSPAEWSVAPVPKSLVEPRNILAALAMLLSLLSLGAIFGAPNAANSAVRPAARGVRTWAADVFWLLGYSPYARLTESAVSTKPHSWAGREEDLGSVQGANLNGLNLRHAQAYRAFFAKAHLWQADLRGSLLSEADLREANLRQADLRSTALDQANLSRAVLQGADLRGANLTQANLRDSNLSYASLANSTLADANLDGADLYAAQMQSALLERASLRKVDLRDGGLQGADLAMADLRDAYLSSAKMAGANLRESRLEQTILTDADLQHADLRYANLQGATLQGANLTGANLQGAQLHGAFGLSALQLCATLNLAQAQLDDILQHDVSVQCAPTR